MCYVKKLLITSFNKATENKMGKLIINKRWFFFIAVFVIAIALGVWTLKENFVISLMIIIVFGLLLLGYLFLIPNSYRLDEKSITVYYCFGLKTTASWEKLKHIEDHYSKCEIFPWFREYHIGYFETKNLFWHEAVLPKNNKTKKLIENYYRNSIEKYG